LKRINGLDMVTLCDMFEEKAGALKDEFGVEYATCKAGKLFLDSSLAAIYMTTQQNTRGEPCISCWRRASIYGRKAIGSDGRELPEGHLR